MVPKHSVKLRLLRKVDIIAHVAVRLLALMLP